MLHGDRFCHSLLDPHRGSLLRHEVKVHVVDDVACFAWPSETEARIRIFIAVSDASHGNEGVFLDAFGEREAFRSRGGKVVFLATKDLWEKPDAHVHITAYGSIVQK